MRELQIYACDDAGKLIHAGPHDFLDTIPLTDQCWRLEQIWRRWRDLQIANWRPVGTSRWKQTRHLTAPIDERLKATVYVLVDPESGQRVDEIRV